MESTTDLVTESVGDLTIAEETKNDQHPTFWSLPFKQKLSRITEVITVEPLIGAYVSASILCGPALLTLEFEKSCRVNMGYNDSVCEAILNGEHELYNYTDHNAHVQKVITNMHSWQSPIQSVMPFILILFLGSYSDRHSVRKPFLLFPLFGELFAVLGCILCVIFMRSWPIEAQGVLQTVVPSFFGGQPMITMAVFSYIADVSTIEMRTLRVGIVQIVLNVCVPVAHSLSGVLFLKLDYLGMLLLAGFLYLFAIVYGVFWINEPKTKMVGGKDDKAVEIDRNGTKTKQTPHLCQKTLIFLKDVFDPRHAIETINLILKKKAGNKRLFILVILITLFVYAGVNVAEANVFYLYTQNVLGYTPVDLSFFNTLNTLVHLIGTLLAVPLFTKVLNLSDLIILVLTFIDKIVANIIFAVAKSIPILYLASVVSFITGVTPIGIRSLATKVVSEDDLGKAQSLFGICEAISSTISIPVYNKIYENTLSTIPAAFFYFGAALYILCSIVISAVIYAYKISCGAIILNFVYSIIRNLDLPIFYRWMYARERTKKNHQTPNDINGTNGNAAYEKPIQMEDIQITHM